MPQRFEKKAALAAEGNIAPTMIRSLALVAVLMCFPAEACFACQACVTYEVHDNLRWLFGGQLVGEPDHVLAHANVRIFRTRALRKGEESRKPLSCLDYVEVGERVHSGKTDKDGVFKLQDVPAGTYWLALRTKHAWAVYLIEIPEADRDGVSTMIAVNGGMVGNKCNVEPIKYFFH